MHYIPFTVSGETSIHMSSEALVSCASTGDSEEVLAVVSKTLHTSAEACETKSSEAENLKANEFDVVHNSPKEFEWTPTD